jgi:hypothetical protein
MSERERRESDAIMRRRDEAQQVRAMLGFDGRFDPNSLLPQAGGRWERFARFSPLSLDAKTSSFKA